MRMLEMFKYLFKHDINHDHPERHIAVGSEAMHDAGLTDQETAGIKVPRKEQKEIFIKHNTQRPEEKIRTKQKLKTPV